MSRKQKIIISITGIFLVLMILVGLTYAYFLTKITGNTNTKSISVSTANLVLEYGENTNVVQGIENAEPGYSVEKIFTATNKGNSTVTYGVALENIVNELSRQEDLVYTLTCTSYLKSGFNLASDGTITGTIDGTCNGVGTEKQFPSTSTMLVMTTNTIDTTHTHAYKLIVTYKEMNVDQSEDMNKTFSAKVNIVDLRANADKINPYSANKTTLNYQIINSAIEGGTNRTIYGSEVTTFTSVSGENERVLNTAPDDYGTSYYYRGNVLDNYVTFADKTWRIVRINGDGSIRLILNDITSTSNFNNDTLDGDNAVLGYMYGKTESNTYEETHQNKYDSVIKKAIDSWYKTNIEDTNNSVYISDTIICGDKELASNGIGGVATQLGYGTNETYYAAVERLLYNPGQVFLTILSPTLKCAEKSTTNYSRYTVSETTLLNGNKTNGNLTYSIGLLSADEVVYAGSAHQSNTSYYLYNSSITNWWTMTVYGFSSFPFAFYVDNTDGQLHYWDVPSTLGIRPVINLKSSVLLKTGDGTKENPYTVKLS